MQPAQTNNPVAGLRGAVFVAPSVGAESRGGALRLARKYAGSAWGLSGPWSMEAAPGRRGRGTTRRRETKAGDGIGSARAARSYGGGRSRALRHQSPGRGAPRATPSPKDISFPRRMHSPAEVRRWSVLSVSWFARSRARALPPPPPTLSPPPLLCERVRRLGPGAPSGGSVNSKRACRLISSLAGSSSRPAPRRRPRARNSSRFLLSVLRHPRRQGQRRRIPNLFVHGACGPCRRVPPSRPPRLRSGAQAAR